MKLEYTEEQMKLLKDKMSMFLTARLPLILATILVSLMFVLGIVLIVYGLTFIGVIISLIMLVPLIVTLSFMRFMSALTHSIKKNDFSIFATSVQTSTAIPGSPSWQNIVTDESATVYYFAEGSKDLLTTGTDIHVVVCNRNPRLMFGIDPIF